MNLWWVVAGVLVVLAALGWYLSFVARRLDRLHRRVEGACSALDAQLVRRAQAATEVALDGLLDPASAVLLHAAATAAAASARRAPMLGLASDPVAIDTAGAALNLRERAHLADLGSEREAAESDLSRTLRLTLDLLPDDHPVLATEEIAALADVCHRGRLARRFVNDAVTASLAVRRKRVVRWFRLAGTAPPPQTVEIDDEPSRVLRADGVPGGG